MNGGIGQCAICLEEPAQFVKWANDECTHSFCADCTTRLLEWNVPLCPLCRRPYIRPRDQQFVRRHVLQDFITIVSLTFDIIMTTIIQVWRFTQTNSPMKFMWWVVTIWAALFASLAYSAALCNAHDVPNILHFYDANETIVFSWNITIVKQAIVYCREHTLLVDMMCQMITK